MTRREHTIPAGYFDEIYRGSDDPWQFETSPYERRKYSATLALLGDRPYARALEIGCSIGVFTARLSRRCIDLLAIDASEIALARARKRVGSTNVQFERRMVPGAFPPGRFDLIVLSEILYYLSPDNLSKLAGQCIRALDPGGELILCHWLGETDYPMAGHVASELFASAVRGHLPRRVIAHDTTYRLERISA